MESDDDSDLSSLQNPLHYNKKFPEVNKIKV